MPFTPLAEAIRILDDLVCRCPKCKGALPAECPVCQKTDALIAELRTVKPAEAIP